MCLQNTGANSKLTPLPHEPAGFYDRGATVDIPLNSASVIESINTELPGVIVSYSLYLFRISIVLFFN